MTWTGPAASAPDDPFPPRHTVEAVTSTAPEPPAPHTPTGIGRGPTGHRRDVVPEAIAADLRQQILERLRLMSINHAKHAWNRRYKDPIAPYGLAFLYATPSSNQGWQELQVATKLWLEGETPRDLARLLFRFTREIPEVRRSMTAQAQTFDPRLHLANRKEEQPAPDPAAVYIGIGTTSLDTPAGSWAEMRRRVDDASQLPAMLRACLWDDGLILSLRGGEQDFNSLNVQSTHSLSTTTWPSVYPWRPVARDVVLEHKTEGPVFRCMLELDHLLREADVVRRVGRDGT